MPVSFRSYSTFWLNSNTTLPVDQNCSNIYDLHIMQVEKYDTHVRIEKQCARKGYMQIESNCMYYNAKVYT